MFVVECLIPHFQKQRIQTLIWPHRLHCPDPSVLINKLRGKPSGSLWAPGLLSSAECGDRGWAGTPGYFPTVGHTHSLLGVCYFVLQWQVIRFASSAPFCPSHGQELKGEGWEASWIEPSIRMQVVDWDRKPVDADKERYPNNMNANEGMLVKLHSSEERCCIIIIFVKQVLLQYTQPLIWSSP